MNVRLAYTWLLVWLMWLPSDLSAHSFSLVQGAVLVHRKKLDLTLKIASEDILWSAGMDIARAGQVDRPYLEKGATAHRKYLLDGMVLRDADGQRIEGVIIKVESPPVPEGGISVEDLLPQFYIYHVEYSLLSPPATLTFQQNFHTGRTLAMVSMQASIKRAGQDSGIIVPIPGGDAILTVAFDWSNPSALPTEVAQVSPVAEPSDLFFYIQNDEVRVEILMPLATLEALIPVSRTNNERFDIDEQNALRLRLERFFDSQNEVRIDGVIIRPKIDRIDFVGPDTMDLSTRPASKSLDAISARLAVILSYTAKSPPRQVNLKWSLFNEQVRSVRPLVFGYDKSARFVLTPTQPTFVWTNTEPVSLPKIEVVDLKQSADSESARFKLTEKLIQNVYRGFDYRKESDIYDALAQSVSGKLLTDLYLKIKQGLILQEQGGAIARVSEVKVIAAAASGGSDKSGFRQHVTWQVTGTVEHWGHIHTRINEYSADLGFAPLDGAWRIISLDATKQNQVKSVMSLRKL